MPRADVELIEAAEAVCEWAAVAGIAAAPLDRLRLALEARRVAVEANGDGGGLVGQGNGKSRTARYRKQIAGLTAEVAELRRNLKKSQADGLAAVAVVELERARSVGQLPRWTTGTRVESSVCPFRNGRPLISGHCPCTWTRRSVCPMPSDGAGFENDLTAEVPR